LSLRFSSPLSTLSKKDIKGRPSFYRPPPPPPPPNYGRPSCVILLFCRQSVFRDDPAYSLPLPHHSLHK
jgi:hypothetical protein